VRIEVRPGLAVAVDAKNNSVVLFKVFPHDLMQKWHALSMLTMVDEREPK
jgi:hypothetical protein